MLVRIMRMFITTSLVLVSLISFSQENNYVNRLCNKYEDWFASDTIKWTFEDSLASLDYRNKLFDLYQPIEEFYFNGATPYLYMYNVHHYDTALLFSVIKLYADSKEEFDRQVGIPLNLATRLINNDAFIVGTVVDKIDKYPECRFYTTTYLVRTDSVIFSYFPIEIGDTVLIHSPFNGYNGCNQNDTLHYSLPYKKFDYEVGGSGFCFYLDRKGFINHQQLFHGAEDEFFDPFCNNSFVRSASNDKQCKSLKEVDQKKLAEFVKRIKTWKK
ncbi:MAG: hypothetical protein K8R74_04730 [Bacteroidales bacterium]|nr:hypothetical protein [Bacteroidales bacterium]